MKLLGIEVTPEEFNNLFCEQAKGKELKVIDGKVVAVEHEVSEEELLQAFRQKREIECFTIINRGKLWYDKLTKEQLNELQIWYEDWLNVTETKDVPEKPVWIK